MNGLDRCQHPQTNSSCNILNPHDSQGNQIADEDGVYPTLRGCGGAGYQQGYCLANRKSTYQDTTGALCASGYDKLGTQEAMNDMYVVSSSWDGSQTSPTLTANNANGAQRMPDKDNFNAVITNQQAVCYGVDSYNQTADLELSETIRTNAGGDSSPKVCAVQCLETYHCTSEEEKVQTLKARDYKDPQVVAYVQDITKG